MVFDADLRQNIERDWIDKEIKDLILNLNSLGFKTYSSCSGHGQVGHIGFLGHLSDSSIEQIRELIANQGYNIVKIDKWHHPQFGNCTTFDIQIN